MSDMSDKSRKFQQRASVKHQMFQPAKKSKYSAKLNKNLDKSIRTAFRDRLTELQIPRQECRTGRTLNTTQNTNPMVLIDSDDIFHPNSSGNNFLSDKYTLQT